MWGMCRHRWVRILFIDAALRRGYFCRPIGRQSVPELVRVFATLSTAAAPA